MLIPWHQSAKYRLDSIVCHSGSSANAGHYYSFVRTSDGDWFRQDDSTSTKVAFHNQSHLLSMKSAYVLIYTRTDSEASSGLSSKSQLPSAVPLSTENKKASVPDSPSDTSIDGPQSISINEHQKMGPIAHGMKRKTLDDTGVTNNGRCTNRPRILSDLPSKAKYSNNPFSLNKVNDSPRSEPDLGERVDRSASRNPLLAKPENSEQDPFKNFSIPSGFSNKGHSAKAVTTAASAAGVSTFYGGGGGQSYRRVPHQYGGKHKPRRSY